MSTNENILICGVNWLGDACMTMPALQLFRKKHSEAKISILIKPALKPLWKMHPDIDNIICLDSSFKGMFKTAKVLKTYNFTSAYILPNSWRSALLPFMAGIPKRIGQTGHHRQLLLTEKAKFQSEHQHQQWEYVDILKLGNINDLPSPKLNVPDTIPNILTKKLKGKPSPKLIAILPGAARGPSKQWPKENYISAAKNISARCNSVFVILGTDNESELCSSVCSAIGDNAISLAGATSLSELIAVLSKCATVLCNDSGGMHLSACTGTSVVAIYGITDPTKTGPLGDGHKIIQAKNVTVSRDIPRDSAEACTALRSIEPEQVADATISILSELTDGLKR